MAQARRQLSRFPDLLILGQEDWDGVERRNQRLVRALAGRHPRTRFCFVEQARRPREFRRWRAPRPRQLAANLWVVSVLRPLPDQPFWDASNRIEAMQIRRAARALGLQEPWIWTQDPRAADLLDRLAHGGLIFDMTDDWVAFEVDPVLAAAAAARTDRLLKEADEVLACSPWLGELARRQGREAVLVPNAVDLGVIETPKEVPPAVNELPAPRLGYVGTLHSSRIDAGLLSRVAELRSDWSVLLLGPNLLEPTDAQRLLRTANVHYLGVCEHDEVAAYLAGLDIALIPNRVTDFTRSLNPLKAYQYLAAGLPVVSTPAGVPEELAAEITLADGAPEFIAAAERLLAESSDADRQRRQALVATTTWERRAETVEAAIGVGDAVGEVGLVSVVIISFNTVALLERCLEAIAADGYPRLQVIVVDNGSDDGSPAMVAERFPNVELLALGGNVGFGRANNLAFAQVRGDAVLLLNSDAFLHPGAVTELRAVMARHPEAGAVGPRILNPDGSLQRSAWPFPAPGRLLLEAFALHRPLRRLGLLEDLAIWDHQGEQTVDFLIGACLLIRAEALRDVDGFDETFYMYGEETDLQRRLLTRGQKSVLAPSATVTHLGGASPLDDVARLRLFYAGQFTFLRKHGGPGAVALARLALLAGSLLRGRPEAARIAITPAGNA